MVLSEFLYVDVDRVRSLLSQMAGGFIEEIRTSSGSQMSGEAQAVLLGVGAKGDYSKSAQYEEARSLQDLTFVAFERLANQHGYITELSADVLEPDNWESGQVHELLAPGQLARIECEVQLLDGGFFDSRLQRFLTLSEAIVDMQDLTGGPATKNTGGKNTAAKSAAARMRRQARDAMLTAFMGGTSGPQLNAISRAVQSFVGDSVSLRVLPCGAEHLEFGFTGALLGRREYIQEERENLFSRYGQAPTRWTTVFQVAAIPKRSDEEPTYQAEESLNDAGLISRANMEKSVSGLLGYLEQVGIVEGPRWPSISITPLGLYRTVPKAP